MLERLEQQNNQESRLEGSQELEMPAENLS
jgi:hypothetical protein